MVLMERLLGSKSLPPGFRFHPTDEELCMYYLKRKVLGKSLGLHMISELDVYKFAPWDLPFKSGVKTKDLTWFFFCPRGRKYVHGGKTNRGTEFGYWKSTGVDRTVSYNRRTVGKIKTLIFYRGKAPKGERTDWVMHEYRLQDQVLVDMGVSQDGYVVSKVFEKSGPGPKNREHHRAHFVEEDWDSDDDDNLEIDSGTMVDSGHLANRAHVQNVHGSSTLADSDNTSTITTDTRNFAAAATTPSFYGSSSQNISNVTVVVDSSTATSAVDAEIGVAQFSAQQPASFVNDPLPSCEFPADELDRILALFRNDESNEPTKLADSEIFNGLEDLVDGYLELDDLK